MPPVVNVSVADAFWRSVDSKFVEKVVRAVLDQEGPFDEVELTVRVTSDEDILELNRKFRNIDMPTDVLSFGTKGDSEDELVIPGDMPDQLGDVVISFEATERQAAQYGHSVERELGWLLTHGVLQLIGYNHDSPRDGILMRKREEMVLKKLGLKKSDDDEAEHEYDEYS